MTMNTSAGLWCTDDSGYLVHVDLPAENTCRMCGTKYLRSISDRRPWQQPVPDTCPKCGHEGILIQGIAFQAEIAAS